MKIVEVIKIPVRYKGTTYSAGESFEMEEIHVNETAVKVIGDVAPKSIEEMTIAELKKYAKDNEIDLGDAKKQKEILKAIQAAEEKESSTDENKSDGDDDQTPSKE